MSTVSVRSTYDSAARHAPPEVRGLPLVGALPAFVWQSFPFFIAARERYGDIYTLKLGLSRWVILNHPRQAEHVLLDNSQNYRKGGALWDSVRVMLGNGLVVSENDFWRRQRRMIQPHFHRKALAGLTEAMVRATDDGLARWERAAVSGQPLDVLPGASAITMRVIARALFGQGLARADIEQISEVMAFAMDYVMLGTLTYGLPRWLPIPGARRYHEGLRKFNALVGSIITNERSAKAPSNSLLAMLVGMVDEESGESMTDAQLSDEVKTFFLAGYETTSLALTWTIHLLTQHPQVLQKVCNEVDTVLAGRAPSFADLPALDYMRRVIQESMRVRPGLWWVPRTAIADDVIDGYAIPAGTNVVVLTYGIHHHAGLWDDPGRFDPERFTSEQVSRRLKNAWLPFGLGQRQCIGKEFSIVEAQIILAMILQRYTLHAVPGPAIKPKLSSTLKPNHSVLVRLEKRTPESSPPSP